jgi:hypothetical protein
MLKALDPIRQYHSTDTASSLTLSLIPLTWTRSVPNSPILPWHVPHRLPPLGSSYRSLEPLFMASRPLHRSSSSYCSFYKSSPTLQWTLDPHTRLCSIAPTQPYCPPIPFTPTPTFIASVLSSPLSSNGRFEVSVELETLWCTVPEVP